MARELWLTVRRIRWTKTEWVVEYDVLDHRPILLRSGAPIRTFDQREEERAWTEEEEHGYTSDPHRGMRNEPEAVDRRELGRQVATSRSRWAAHQIELGEEDRRRQRALRQRLREVYPELSAQGRVVLLAGIERLITDAVIQERERPAS